MDDDTCLHCWEKLAECNCGHTEGYSDNFIYCPYCGHANDPSFFPGSWDENTDKGICLACHKEFALEVIMMPKWSTKRINNG